MISLQDSDDVLVDLFLLSWIFVHVFFVVLVMLFGRHSWFCLASGMAVVVSVVLGFLLTFVAR